MNRLQKKGDAILARKDEFTQLPGPHLCSQVGQNLTKVLQVSLIEVCKRQGGQLSQHDIEHVFDVISNSPEIFSIFQRGYTNCVGLKNSPKYVEVDKDVVAKFIVRAFCADVVKEVFARQIAKRGTEWIEIFVDTLISFIERYSTPDFSESVFEIYKKLALEHGGNLTLATIVDSRSMENAMADAFFETRQKLNSASHYYEKFESRMNNAVGKKFRIAGPNIEKINNHNTKLFFENLQSSKLNNHFRGRVNQQIETLSHLDCGLKHAG